MINGSRPGKQSNILKQPQKRKKRKKTLPLPSSHKETNVTRSRDGDTLEAMTVSVCLGRAGVHIGLAKANLGHTRGASSFEGVITAIHALEKRIIPPSIKYLSHASILPDSKTRISSFPWNQPSDVMIAGPCCQSEDKME